MSQELFFEKLHESRSDDIKVLLKKSYRGIWETAIKKYSDSAHFIYELIQNADDAGATCLEFSLEEEGLWLKHNGNIRFTVSDPDLEDDDNQTELGHLNAITSIGNSNKGGGIDKVEEQKIGKFGIGFKAVFAYTSTPHIYDDLSFKLENYIVPVRIEQITSRKSDETVFYFPFNHREKPKEQAFKEIEDKLRNLKFPTLFLNNIEILDWRSQVDKGTYCVSKGNLRLPQSKFGISIEHQIYESSARNVNDRKELLVFKKRSQHRIEGDFTVQIAFILEEGKLVPLKNNVVYCFFPTKFKLEFGYLIHAPFLLTDSRENLRSDSNWNDLMLQSLAFLSGKSLLLLKELGELNGLQLISDQIFEVLPYDEEDYWDADISFEVLYDTVREVFQEERLLPGRNSKYYETDNAYWVSDVELAELFSDEQLQVLMEVEDCGIVFSSLGQKQLNQSNYSLERFIQLLVSETLDAKKLIRRISVEFTEKQSVEWLIKFYNYLGSRKYLWDDKDKVVVKRPILLNQNREARIPFNKELSAPTIFLSSGNKTSYDTVLPELLNDEGSLAFIKSIGIGIPDIRTEIFNVIIPFYESGKEELGLEEVLEHTKLIVKYYDTCGVENKKELIDRVKSLQFVVSFNDQNDEDSSICSPDDVYFISDELLNYFEGQKDVFFVDEEFYKEGLSGTEYEVLFELFKEAGSADFPRLQRISLDRNYSNRKRLGVSHLELSKTYSDKELIDVSLEGLKIDAKSNLSIEQSARIWKYLILHIEKNLGDISIFNGEYVYVPYRGSYYYHQQFESSLLKFIKEEKWLFDKEKSSFSVNHVFIEDLNDSYDLSSRYTSTLFSLLGIQSSHENIPLDGEDLECYQLGRMFRENGLSYDEAKEIIAERNARKNQGDEVIEDDPVDKTLTEIKNRIKRKKPTNSHEGNSESIDNQLVENEQDIDSYTKPSVDIQKKIEKLRDQAELQIEELTRIERLKEISQESERFSFAWFKALLELECLNSSETNSSGQEISIRFSNISLEDGTERTLVLKNPNRYIPQSIEDVGDLQLKLLIGDSPKTVTVEVVSVKEYRLHAKLSKSADISDIKFSDVKETILDIKNPVFILEELRRAFGKLEFEEEFNLRDNLTEDLEFVFGPPGTGKTTHLAKNVILPLMKEELKILVLTPTNKAADVLTSKVMEEDKGQSYFDWLLRFGNTGDESLEEASILVDKGFDILSKSKMTVITTIARFPYDYFQPNGLGQRIYLNSIEWDYVIVDEASMISLPSIIYVLYKSFESQFIIAGDPFQIEPIASVSEWKDMNIYSMVELKSFKDPSTVPHDFEILPLTTQYRALPAIGELFSCFSYNKVLAHNRVGEEPKKLNLNGLGVKSVNFVRFPVEQFESIYKPGRLNRSNYQIYSALFTVKFAVSLAESMVNGESEKCRIGIICPYRSQSDLIEKTIAYEMDRIEGVEIHTGTIHGFQGDECDIIITVLNPPVHISDDKRMFLNKQNILNVAISRARDYLFILIPDNNVKGVQNLVQLNRIKDIANREIHEYVADFSSKEIEERLFGSESFIYENSFATSHQSVNVYSVPEKLYEVRCEETAIDVQIRQS